MGYFKHQMMESMLEEQREEREDLELTLDDIEAVGEDFKCPNERCDESVCSKSCFARSCFDWCLTHSHPSVEDVDGTVSVTIGYSTRDDQGRLVCRTEVEQRRRCGHEEARVSGRDCKVVVSPFRGDDVDGVVVTPEGQLWQFEHERYMGEIMARESP
ncbi:hypothetical protein F4823DRAFT_406947 [Ustulina deusta]|nr:hypothetical protein F4823DRAFT_406947 [Ustulina deusta]